MAETVADIAIGVTADIGPLMRETARAEAALGKFDRVVQGVGRGFTDFGGKATALGARMSIATAAIGAAAGAAIAITRSAADAGEAIANGAKAANMSTTAFQEYRYALSEAADMSGEEFADATVKLNKRLGEAMAGSQSAQAAFEKLGISQADLASGTVTGDTAMAALVKTLETTTDPAIAAAIATEVLGKSGARMGGMLAGTAGTVDALRESARSLGIVMSKDAVEASDKFNEKWDATVKQFEAVKIAIATQLMPIIVNELLPLIQEKVIPGIVSIINTMGEWVTAFQELPAPVQTAIEIVAGLFAVGGPLLIAIGATASVIGALVAAAGPIGLLIVAAGLLTAAWVTWGDDFKAAIGPAIDWVSGKFAAFMSLIDSIVAKLKSWKDTAADFIGAGDPSTFTPNPNYKPDPMSNIGGGGVDRLGGGAGHDQLGIDMADGMVNGMTARLSERSSEIAAAIDTSADRAGSTRHSIAVHGIRGDRRKHRGWSGAGHFGKRRRGCRVHSDRQQRGRHQHERHVQRDAWCFGAVVPRIQGHRGGTGRCERLGGRYRGAETSIPCQPSCVRQGTGNRPVGGVCHQGHQHR